MRLGNRTQLKAALLPHYGDTYTDDNEVVRTDDENGATVAYLFPNPAKDNSLRVVPRNGDPEFVIDVEGAGYEPHELPTGPTN